MHDNSLRHTMEFEDIIHEDLIYHRPLERVLQGTTIIIDSLHLELEEVEV